MNYCAVCGIGISLGRFCPEHEPVRETMMTIHGRVEIIAPKGQVAHLIPKWGPISVHVEFPDVDWEGRPFNCWQRLLRGKVPG